MRCRATLPAATVGALVLYRTGTGRYSITADDPVRPDTYTLWGGTRVSRRRNEISHIASPHSAANKRA